MTLSFPLAAVLLAACPAVAADPSPYAAVNPAVFPPDDPRAKDLPRMVALDQKRRLQEAGVREAKAFAAVQTREQWEAFRDARIKALRESLGTLPAPPKDLRITVTRELPGDGFRIRNIVYESRPGLWVSANLYLPAKPPEKMPGILISHSHHTSKTHGELQDMGMTWARAGCAVLVPDHLGHGERRQHAFVTEKDYPKPFRTGRQDYYFRYTTNLQLSLVGDSLMGWMVNDLMRGVDVLLKQPTIDPKRIILLGAVAGGGDPAGVTAALDPRISCVVPFNFGGWQPESSAMPDPDRNFPWFGDGYWESTRGLRGGAAGGFAHWVIVGGVAPRPVIYAHEFVWDAAKDPVWPRLQKVFGFYGAADRLAVVHGAGSVKGTAGPENTHCTHIGAVHRKGIYPALDKWFGMPVPTEYSNRRPSADLVCWTDAAKAELKPQSLTDILRKQAVFDRFAEMAKFARSSGQRDDRNDLRLEWTHVLGDTAPRADAKLVEARTEEVAGGRLTRFVLETEPSILVPGLLFTPKGATGREPVVVMLAQAGKAVFLKERGNVIAAFLQAGVTVCLVDVRGTGEATPRDASPSRTSSRTSHSQTEQILGRTMLAAQLRDLRSVFGWLKNRTDINPDRLAVWGDSFVPPNPLDSNLAAPLDTPDLPRIAEPGAAGLAALAALYTDGVKAVYTRGGLRFRSDAFRSPFLYLPHDAVPPGCDPWMLADVLPNCGIAAQRSHPVDGQNRPVEGPKVEGSAAAAWVIEQLSKK
jgi:dienelactone hydrolase